jgi:hypothetical protein
MANRRKRDAPPPTIGVTERRDDAVVLRWDDLGPHMRALASDKLRAFVYLLVSQPHRGNASALRRAGLATNPNPYFQAKSAYQYAHRPDVLRAINEEAKRVLRSAHPVAVRTVVEIAADKRNPQAALRACEAILARTDPVEVVQNVKVEHQHSVDVRLAGDAARERVRQLCKQVGLDHRRLPAPQPDVVEAEFQEVTRDDG